MVSLKKLKFTMVNVKGNQKEGNELKKPTFIALKLIILQQRLYNC